MHIYTCNSTHTHDLSDVKARCQSSVLKVGFHQHSSRSMLALHCVPKVYHNLWLHSSFAPCRQNAVQPKATVEHISEMWFYRQAGERQAHLELEHCLCSLISDSLQLGSSICSSFFCHAGTLPELLNLSIARTALDPGNRIFRQ